jgi:hypothetical protein
MRKIAKMDRRRCDEEEFLRKAATQISRGGHSVKLRDALTGGLLAILGFLPVTVPGVYGADPAKPSIGKEAAEDLLRMGQTLRVEEFSFQAETIRV